MPPKEKKRKVQCPECEQECEVIVDDEGDFDGVCDNCGLNVGRVLTKRRYDRALKRMEAADEGRGKPKDKSDPFA